MDDSKTIDEFCEAERICRASFYNMQKRGQAPTVLRIGKIIRITPEAHSAWRRKMEAHSAEPVAA